MLDVATEIENCTTDFVHRKTLNPLEFFKVDPKMLGRGSIG